MTLPERGRGSPSLLCANGRRHCPSPKNRQLPRAAGRRHQAGQAPPAATPRSSSSPLSWASSSAAPRSGSPLSPGGSDQRLPGSPRGSRPARSSTWTRIRRAVTRRCDLRLVRRHRGRHRGIAGGGCGALPVSSRPIVMTLRRRREGPYGVGGRAHHAGGRIGARQRHPPGADPGRARTGLRPNGGPRRAPLSRHPLTVGEAGFRGPPEPRLLPLSANGRPIPRTRDPHRAPGATSSGPCGLRPRDTGLARSGVTSPHRSSPPSAGLVGPAFFSCIDVQHYLGKWPLDAAVCSTPPTRLPPAPIPGLDPIPDTPGSSMARVISKRTHRHQEGETAGRSRWERVPIGCGCSLI